MLADAERDRQLRALGWIIIHIVAKELFNDPSGVLRRVAEALGERGIFVTLARDWEAHFRQHRAAA